MNFSNEQQDAFALPSLDDITFSPLERSYITVERTVLVITMCIVLIAVSLLIYFIKGLQIAYVVIPVISLLLAIFILWWMSINISFRFSGYALRTHDVIFRNGWLIRRTRVVPINRIQHVSVQSGPIERKFGLASVSVFTAGSSSADLTLKGIKSETAHQVKDWLGQQLHGNVNPG